MAEIRKQFYVLTDEKDGVRRIRDILQTPYEDYEPVMLAFPLPEASITEHEVKADAQGNGVLVHHPEWHASTINETLAERLTKIEADQVYIAIMAGVELDV